MIDLLFSDMPVCDGVEAAKRLRVLERKRKAPVLLPSECCETPPSHRLMQERQLLL